jgi:hypothetical protein
MKIDFKEMEFKVKLATDKNKHQNLLAFGTLILKGETGEYFTISGFTLWKSKFGGYNVEVPNKSGFKYCLIEPSLKRKIEREIISQYDHETIPVIDDK